MAFAAVQSLMELLERIMDADSNWVLDNEQQIELLHEKVGFLRDIFENISTFSSEEVKDLEMKIRDIAFEAEDIIESYLLQSESDKKTDEMRDETFKQDLEKSIEEIWSIHEEAMEIRRLIVDQNYVQQGNCLQVDGSKHMFRGKSMMVGLDDELMTAKDWLTSSSSKLEVISIVGMGGIGKTALARNVFDDPPLTVYHFDIKTWVTVSREYQVREILERLLGRSTSETSRESEEKLAERLYESLKCSGINADAE